MASILYITATFVALISVLIFRRQRPVVQQLLKQYSLASVPKEQLPQYIQKLIIEFPESVILQSDISAFQKAQDINWAQQNREIVPTCIVRPRDVWELSKILIVLKVEYENRKKAGIADAGFFSIRSGGINPGLGVSTVKDGVVIDLSLFNEVTPAADGKSVTLGTGSSWIEVYKKLDELGLVVMGGRNSPVGVGGLILQGKLPSGHHLTLLRLISRWHLILLSPPRLRMQQCIQLRSRPRGRKYCDCLSILKS